MPVNKASHATWCRRSHPCTTCMSSCLNIIPFPLNYLFGSQLNQYCINKSLLKHCFQRVKKIHLLHTFLIYITADLFLFSIFMDTLTVYTKLCLMNIMLPLLTNLRLSGCSVKIQRASLIHNHSQYSVSVYCICLQLPHFVFWLTFGLVYPVLYALSPTKCHRSCL